MDLWLQLDGVRGYVQVWVWVCVIFTGALFTLQLRCVHVYVCVYVVCTCVFGEVVFVWVFVCASVFSLGYF